MRYGAVFKPEGHETDTFTLRGHGFVEGDRVDIFYASSWGRWGELLTRPRAKYVKSVGVNSFEVEERRMTWAEWRRALWAAVCH